MVGLDRNNFLASWCKSTVLGFNYIFDRNKYTGNVLKAPIRNCRKSEDTRNRYVLIENVCMMINVITISSRLLNRIIGFLYCLLNFIDFISLLIKHISDHFHNNTMVHVECTMVCSSKHTANAVATISVVALRILRANGLCIRETPPVLAHSVCCCKIGIY